MSNQIPCGFTAPFYAERDDNDVIHIYDSHDCRVTVFNTHTQMALENEADMEEETQENLRFAQWLVGKMNA